MGYGRGAGVGRGEPVGVGGGVRRGARVGRCNGVGRGLGVETSLGVGVAVTGELAWPLLFGKGEGEELGYRALYGNIVTMPNGSNVAVPV
jgi:hypothetical protein